VSSELTLVESHFKGTKTLSLVRLTIFCPLCTSIILTARVTGEKVENITFLTSKLVNKFGGKKKHLDAYFDMTV